jgi:hypothetical protein
MNLVLIALAVLVVVAVFVGYAAVVAGARADRRSEAFDRKVALRVASRSGSSGESSPLQAEPPSARRVPPEGPSAA